MIAGRTQPRTRVFSVALGLHHQEDRAIHQKCRHHRCPRQQGVGVQLGQQIALVAEVFLQGHPPGHVAQGHPDQQRGGEARDAEGPVPEGAPRRARPQAAHVDRDPAEDQHEQQQDEGQVEPAEHRGVDVGKGCEQGPAAGDQPDLVAVPEGADRVQEDAAVGVARGQQMQRAHTQVEPVQDRVPGQEDPHQDVPDHVDDIPAHQTSSPIPRSSARGPLRIFWSSSTRNTTSRAR